MCDLAILALVSAPLFIGLFVVFKILDWLGKYLEDLEDEKSERKRRENLNEQNNRTSRPRH